MVQIIFKMFEIAEKMTKLRVVANSLIFTTNSILNVKLCITKTNVFVIRFIYAFELIIRSNTTHNYIKFIFRISILYSIIIDIISNFFSIIDIKKSAQQAP